MLPVGKELLALFWAMFACLVAGQTFPTQSPTRPPQYPTRYPTNPTRMPTFANSNNEESIVGYFTLAIAIFGCGGGIIWFVCRKPDEEAPKPNIDRPHWARAATAGILSADGLSRLQREEEKRAEGEASPLELGQLPTAKPAVIHNATLTPAQRERAKNNRRPVYNMQELEEEDMAAAIQLSLAEMEGAGEKNNRSETDRMQRSAEGVPRSQRSASNSSYTDSD